jgi:DNA-binding response OmpR family regulator
MPDCSESTASILLIDDDPSFSDFIAIGLGKAGLPTTIATTGLSGLDALQRHRYSLVLLDLLLPDIDGLEVLRRMKANGPLPPVILLSGMGTIRFAVDALRLGAVDFLEKPLTVCDLADTVRSNLPVAADQAGTNNSALHDLVRWVMTVVVADTDTRTIDDWARRAGTSSPTIFARCTKAQLKAKALLDLGRLLRIARRPAPKPKYIADAFDSKDIRTVGSLLQRARISSDDFQRADPVRLLAMQRLVSSDQFKAILKSAMQASYVTPAEFKIGGADRDANWLT